MREESCVCCGRPVPEGTMVCLACEDMETGEWERNKAVSEAFGKGLEPKPKQAIRIRLPL